MDFASKVKLAKAGVKRRDINDYSAGEVDDAKKEVRDLIKRNFGNVTEYMATPEGKKKAFELVWQALERNQAIALARQNRQGLEGLDEDIVERMEDNLAKRGFVASDAQFIAMVKSAMKTEAEEKRKKKQQDEEDEKHINYIMSLGRK
jgi:hypothetical protein